MDASQCREMIGSSRKWGRIYVFDDYKTYASCNQVGETVCRLTRIGAGPKGETMVYVLNKSNKKQKPGALIAEIESKHGK